MLSRWNRVLPPRSHFLESINKLFNRSVLALILSCAFVSAPLRAQTIAGQDVVSSEKPELGSEKPGSPNSISSFASDFLHDQKDIWTSPFHINRGDFQWLAPVGAGAVTLAIFDHRISNALKPDTSLRTPSNAISDIGKYAPYAIPGTIWFLGAMKHDRHTAEAGRLAAEAELDSEVVMDVLKLATGRTRPNQTDNMSFPSGHTMSAFALAAVMSREYHDNKLVVVGPYGFATAAGLARVGGLNHFPSDVLVGAVIGELIGRYVVNHHAQYTAQ